MHHHHLAIMDTHVTLFTTFFVCWTAVTSAYPRVGTGKDYPLTDITVEDEISNVKEPTCDELRTMWRFSKRQSRAAEMTNSIPGYKDPFAYNEWEAGAGGGGGPKLRLAVGRPVYYGKMLYGPGPQSQNFRNPEKTKAFSEYFGTPQYFPNTNSKAPKNLFRLGVGGSKDRTGLIAQSTGSFLHLKDLIKKERARELQDQKMREEGRMRAASLKSLIQSKGSFGLVQDDQDLNSYFSKGDRDRDRDRDNEDIQQKGPGARAYGHVVKSAQQNSFNSRSVPSYSSEW